MFRSKVKIAVFVLAAAFVILVAINCSEVIPSLANSDINNRRQEQKDVNSQLGEVREEMDDAVTERKELERLMNELENLKEQSEMTYDELLDLLDAYNGEIDTANGAIEESERLFAEQEELLKARVRHMYMHSNTSSLDVLVESEDLVSFMEKMELYSAISRHDKDILENYKSALMDWEYKRGVQLTNAKDTREKADDQEKQLEGLEEDRTDLERRIWNARRDIDRLNRQEDELEKKSKQLEKEIKELTDKQNAAAKAAAKPVTYNGGAMKWPAPGYTTISSPYGNRMHPVYKVVRKHTGLDIAAPKGANVVAAKGGTVISAGWQGGYGNAVIIDHGGGITTLYGHCSKLLVKTGDNVKEGAIIAKVGSTGVSTGNHLHFEVRKGGVPINPVPKYISR